MSLRRTRARKSKKKSKSNVPMSKLSQTTIFYEGPNDLNGLDIMGVIQLNPAQQDKTEGMVQVWIFPAELKQLTDDKLNNPGLDSSIKVMLDEGLDKANCHHCDFRSLAAGGNGECYCNGRTLYFGGNALLRSLSKRGWPKFESLRQFEQICEYIQQLGLRARVTAYGESLGLPMPYLFALMKILGTAYTNAWEFIDKKDLHWFVKHYMASVQDNDAQERARSLGFRCFKTLPANDLSLDKKTEFRCPGSYEMGYKTGCNDCLGCAGNRPTFNNIQAFKKDVVILNHNKVETLKRYRNEKKLLMELAVN